MQLPVLFILMKNNYSSGKFYTIKKLFVKDLLIAQQLVLS